MKASIRARYLNAMGVTQWFPRTPLETAGPSHPLVEAARQLNTIKENEAVSSSSSSGLASASSILSNLSNSAPASQPITHQAAPQTAALSDSQVSTPLQGPEQALSSRSQGLAINENQTESTPAMPASTESVADLADNPSPSSVLTTATDVPRFALQIMPLCRHISWVFDSHLDQSLILAFCHRVKQGMGIEDGFQPTITQFRWPFIESAHQDQSAAVARQALKAQWQFMQEQGCRHIMAWGKDSSEWLKQAEADIVFCYPETELELTASVKSRVWQALVPLL